METCEYHVALASNIEVVKNDVGYIKNTIHRFEDIPDRVLKTEISIKDLRDRFWLSSLVGGIIGALLGTGATDVMSKLIKWFLG